MWILGLVWHYDLFSHILLRKQTMSKRMFFILCFFKAASGSLLEYLRAFYFAGDIGLPQKHCCATLNIFTYLTVICSFTLHAKCIVAFPLQNGYAIVPQCILHTLPILLQISTCSDWMNVKGQLFAFLLIDHWTELLTHLGVS